jgi:GTPase SAR1 family protein
LYDVSSALTFRSLSQWLQELHENADSHIVVMLVGNKCDLQELRAVATDEGVEFAKSENLLFIETSALDSINVPEAFTRLMTEIVHRMAKNDSGKTAPDAGVKVVKEGISITASPTEPAAKGGCCK